MKAVRFLYEIPENGNPKKEILEKGSLDMEKGQQKKKSVLVIKRRTVSPLNNPPPFNAVDADRIGKDIGKDRV